MTRIDQQNMHHNIPTDSGDILTYAGIEFEATWKVPVVAPAAKVYVRVTTAAEKYTILNERHIVMDQERGFYRAYSSFVGGAHISDIIPTKIRLDLAVAPSGVFEDWSAPTSIDAASLIHEEPLFGVEGQGNRAGQGGRSEERALRILPPGAVALLEFENNSVAAAYLTGHFRFWEVTPEFMPDSISY